MTSTVAAMSLLLAAVCFFSLSVDQTQAVICYNCTTDTNSDCGENIKTGSLSTCEGTSCRKYLSGIVGSGNSKVERSCWYTKKDNGCTSASLGYEVSECYCNSDKCNTASRLQQITWVALISTLLLLVVVRRDI